MIREEPEGGSRRPPAKQDDKEDNVDDELEFYPWENKVEKPENWNHEPKRGGKKHKDKKQASQKNMVETGHEDKRKVKIQDKIFRKVVQQTDDQTGKVQQTGANQGVKTDRQVDYICNILKFFLGQHQLTGKPQYANEERTCQNWQIDEIMKQVSDTNLGDFIIKCPNPDKLPEEWKQKYKVEEKDNQEVSELKMIRASQAMEFFYDLFDVETYSRLQSQRQNVAFLVAFFFLKYKSNFEDGNDDVPDCVLKVYDFYKMVQNKSLKEYMQMRQQENFFNKHQYIIQELFEDDYNKVKCFREKGWGSKSEELEQMWKHLKRMIYLHLSQELLSILGDQKSDQKQECKYIFSKVKSISEMLKTFPDIIEVVLTKVKYYDQHKDEIEERQKDMESQKKGDSSNKGSKDDTLDQKSKKQSAVHSQVNKSTTFDNGKRLLFWGQYLKRTIVGQNVIWVNTKSRPNDVATLLRFSLLYKLVVKSKLFVRQFLSKDEQFIMLVIKTSEQILENYAQKYKITMEVDLGASDLFSFEPVDEYMRPLRLHKYVTDQQFLDKYHIKPSSGGGGSSDKKEELQSIESQALNIYKKVQVMNEDELRTLVMTEQMQANDLLKFLRKKLNIDYIEQHPLQNTHNRDNTDRQVWQLYYVYNKVIINFIKRIKALFTVSRKESVYYAELEGNLGMLLRLMFLKALNMCNQMFYEHRQMRSIIPRQLSNLCNTEDKENKLKTIWHYMGIDKPSGYFPYERIDKNQKLWRKFQVNELKERSKFFPSERLMITNRVIIQIINLSSSLDKLHILNYYPLHDPFTLKNIQVAPYISVIKKLKKEPKRQNQMMDASAISRLYSQYECKYTISDFTKMSVEKQLEFKCTEFKTFETGSIRAYCGQKIAFYFTLIKFLALKAWPLVLPAFIIQILLWVQNGHISKYGTSTMTGFNNVVISFWCIVNLIWTTDIIQTWKQQQVTLAQQYGVTKIQDNQERRVKFEGEFKRDFQTDQLNFEYVPAWQTVLKTTFTVVLNFAYVALVAMVILMLFLFKTFLYQSGYPQLVVQHIPSVLIAIATQIFTKVYTIMIKNITNFQNHKTVTQYQSSLVSKSALISFVINFYSIFIYAYFSGYLGSSYVCRIRTTVTNINIDNCDYYVSSQLLSLIMVDFATTIVGAFTPLIFFKLYEYLDSRDTKKTSKFNFSFFQSIDNFYEEQDKMDSYMYTEELDQSWVGYMNIVNVFAATALFAPALPLAYTMMFLTGIVRLHASKYDVIYYKQRILPTKTNSINWWLTILEIISFIAIITNVGYLIYTRKVFVTHQAKYFFFFIILSFAIKYFMLAQYSSGTDIMAKRNQIKTTDILKNRRRDQFQNIPEQLNTDIENVIYDQSKLKRKFHDIKEPNIKPKDNQKEKAA